MTRVEQLNAAVDRVRGFHDAWSKDAQSGPIPGEGLVSAVYGMVDVFEAGPCPPSHVPLNNAVSALNLAQVEWQDGEYGADGGPPPRYYRAMGEVFDLRNRLNAITPRRPPTIALLRGPQNGATDQQIARHIYGYLNAEGQHEGPLLDARGNVDWEKFEREAAEPGSVVPMDWINPRDRSALEAIGYYDKTPAVKMEADQPSREDQEARAIDLLRQGAFVTQVANVTGLTVAEVSALAAANAVPVESQSFAPSVSLSDTDLDSAINGLLIQGVKPHDVVSQLKARGWDQANLGRVNAVAKRRQTVPA